MAGADAALRPISQKIQSQLDPRFGAPAAGTEGTLRLVLAARARALGHVRVALLA